MHRLSSAEGAMSSHRLPHLHLHRFALHMRLVEAVPSAYIGRIILTSVRGSLNAWEKLP